MRWVVGIDIGGTGSRAVLAPFGASGGGPRLVRGDRAAVTDVGSTVPEIACGLLAEVLREWPEARSGLAAVAVGASGMATLVADPDALRGELAAVVDAGGTAQGARRSGQPSSGTATGGATRAAAIAVAGDLVTTHLGALGGEAGAVVAVGTGAIALGTDLAHTWQRVDGWGHLIGDLGAGVWIGIQAIQVAAAAHDGRSPRGRALLAVAQERFGPTQTWPSQIYTQHDRAGLLASLTPAVAALAADGDEASADIMAAAGTHIADTLAAALVTGVPPVASYTGGVFEAGGVFARSFQQAFRQRRPDAELRAPSGTPVDGALTLARRAARGELRRRPGFVWCDEASA